MACIAPPVTIRCYCLALRHLQVSRYGHAFALSTIAVLLRGMQVTRSFQGDILAQDRPCPE